MTLKGPPRLPYKFNAIESTKDLIGDQWNDISDRENAPTQATTVISWYINPAGIVQSSGHFRVPVLLRTVEWAEARGRIAESARPMSAR